jgi:hypothetical protein
MHCTRSSNFANACIFIWALRLDSVTGLNAHDDVEEKTIDT